MLSRGHGPSRSGTTDATLLTGRATWPLGGSVVRLTTVEVMPESYITAGARLGGRVGEVKVVA